MANGLKNAEELIRRVERGEADYIFIEIMAYPEIKTIYEEFFGAPLSQRSHELLHTHYHARKKRHNFSHLN